MIKANSKKCIEENHGISIPEYNRVHAWLKYYYGKANKCENEHCKQKSKNFDWALNPGAKYEKKRENFAQKCKSCHAIQDSTDRKREKIRNMFNALSVKECEDCKGTFNLKLLQVVCAECHIKRKHKSARKYRQKNLEGLYERHAIYLKENKDKVNEYQRRRHKEKRGEKFGIRSIDKLSKKDIRDIQKLFAKGYTKTELAKKYNMAFSTIFHHLKKPNQTHP